MDSLYKRLNPTNSLDLFWDPETIESLLPPEVERVSEEFNTTAYNELHKPLQQQIRVDKATGIAYAVLKNENDSSETAVVHFNPFANGLTINMLLRAEYCRRAFRALGLTDEDGKKLSVITLASPSRSSTIKLNKEHRLRAAEGQLDAIAAHYLEVVRGLGYKRLEIIGFSQGASVAAAAAAMAPSVGLIPVHLAIGEPANIMTRKKTSLMRHFAASAKHLKPAVRAGRIQAFEIAHRNETATRYVLGILRRPRLNYVLLKSLSKELFVHDITRALKNGTRITIGYGDITTISPPKIMQQIVTTTRKTSPDATHAIHTVEIKDAHHTWSDQLNLLATFYGYALTR